MPSSELSQDFRIKKQHKHCKWHKIQKEKGNWKKKYNVTTNIAIIAITNFAKIPESK
jgi:hypothetical protein